MKALALLAALMIVSCGKAPSTTAASRPSASSLSVACRLPVTTSNSAGQGLAGFATLPDQTFTADVSAPASTLYYDAAFARWLPAQVDQRAVSSDGSQYVMLTWSPDYSVETLHLVDLPSGQDRVIYRGAIAYWPVAFTSDGIYVSSAHMDAYPTGLWVVNPTSGQFTLINSSITEPVVGSRVSWGLSVDPSDPNPASIGMGLHSDSVERFDLGSASPTQVFYRPGAWVTLMGTDPSNNLFISVVYGRGAPESAEMWLLETSGLTFKLASVSYLPTGSEASAARSSDAPVFFPDTLGEVDAHGVWFRALATDGQNTEIWLYANNSMQTIATLDGDFQIAGSCR